MHEDSRESWVENSELGQDEGGQTTGTAEVASWSKRLAYWRNCLTVISGGIAVGGSLTTDELEDGSTGATMLGGTWAEQQLAGGKSSASALGLACVGSECARA